MDRSDPWPPDVLRKKRIDLGRSVLGRYRIYLDTNFWVRLRDAARGSSGVGAFGLLLQLLRQGVAEHRLICPLSPATFAELLAQGDIESRQATATLIDELSDGVAMQSQHQQLLAQVLNVLPVPEATNASADFRLYGWTRVGYPCGDLFPVAPALPRDVSEAALLGTDELLWNMPLVEHIATFPLPTAQERLRRTAFAETLTREARAHQADWKTREELRLAELRGVLEALLPDLGGHFAGFLQAEHGRRLDPSRAGAMLANILYESLARGKLRERLPQIWIRAVLHSAMRHDRQRSFREGDLLDHEHATAALGLCCAMFTDRALHHLLESEKLDTMYGVQVRSSPEAAIDLVQEVLTLRGS